MFVFTFNVETSSAASRRESPEIWSTICETLGEAEASPAFEDAEGAEDALPLAASAAGVA